jgi:outer membrane lipoprotein-sorting protein
MCRHKSLLSKTLLITVTAMSLSLGLTIGTALDSSAAPDTTSNTTSSSTNIKIASRQKTNKASKSASESASVPKAENANFTNAAPFIDRMLKAADSYKDYVFEYEMTNYKGKKLIEKGKFYFKKPRMMRLEEVGSFRKGSIAVMGSGGKIRAKPGGALSFMTVDLAPSSDYLRSANGYPMVDSDLTSLAQALKTFIEKDSCVARVTETTVQSTSNAPSQVYMLEVYHGSNFEGEIFKRVAIDPKSMLPVEWWDYIGGKLSSHSIWNNFKGNVGLADDVFTIKGAKTI